MEELVFKSGKNNPATTGLSGAEKFKKDHHYVLEAIHNLITTAEKPALLQKKTWLTEKEAIEYTSFGKDTLQKFREEGTRNGKKLPYVRIGTNLRYRRSDIDKFFENHIIK